MINNTQTTEKKTRVLMQLRDQHTGFAGITQETQLLFSSLLDTETCDLAGLIVKDRPYDLRKLPRALPTQQAHNPIKKLSDFIISYQTKAALETSKLSIRELGVLSYHILTINCLTTLGASMPLDYFNSQGFEHFLWEHFFSKTLSPQVFKKVTNTSFRTLQAPLTLLQLAGLMAVAYPKLDTRDYDIFLAQTPIPVRVEKNTQLIIRYHDAIPVFAPHLVYQPKFHQLFHYKALLQNAKKGLFACTSHSSRHELLRICPELDNRSVVIHDLVSEEYYPEKHSRHTLCEIIFSRTIPSEILRYALDEMTHSAIPFPFLLMVSTIEPRKNHIRLIEAWEIMRHTMTPPLKLILVGTLGWNYLSILDKMRPWQERGELFHLQHLPKSELRFLYQQAACVVCPSVMEGFDLTGVEAMLCGGKVAASRIPVHQEVYAEAAVYFDSYSVESQADAIASIILPSHKDFAANLSAKGIKWGKRYQCQAILPQWEQFFETIRAGVYQKTKDPHEKPCIA